MAIAPDQAWVLSRLRLHLCRPWGADPLRVMVAVLGLARLIGVHAVLVLDLSVGV